MTTLTTHLWSAPIGVLLVSLWLLTPGFVSEAVGQGKSKADFQRVETRATDYVDDDEEHEHDHEEWDEEAEFDEDHWEHELEELRRHEHHLGHERLEQSTVFGRLELINEMDKITQDVEKTAAFAVLHVKELMEPEEALRFLKEMYPKVADSTKRLIRIQLAEIYAHEEEMEKVKEQLEILITGSGGSSTPEK